MKKHHVLLLAAAVVVGLGAGAWYEKQQPRDAIDPTLRLVKAAEELKTEGYSTGGMAASRLDQALVALHEVEKAENSTAAYNFGVYQMYSAIWSAHRRHAPAPVLLEIGPGLNLGQGVIFVMTGAKKYYGLDAYRDPQFYNRYSYQAVAALLTTVAPQLIVNKADSAFRAEGDKIAFNPEKIEYLYPRQSYDIPLPPGSVDYVYSHSVFEHVTDPEATIRAIFRLLPHGGLTAHHFDLGDHRDRAKPLEFLRLDAQAFKSREEKDRVVYSTNRWRLPDFTAAFERSGFRIQKVEVTSKLMVTEEMRRSLHPDYQKYSL